jgi:hypothetical protein
VSVNVSDGREAMILSLPYQCEMANADHVRLRAEDDHLLVFGGSPLPGSFSLFREGQEYDLQLTVRPSPTDRTRR